MTSFGMLVPTNTFRVVPPWTSHCLSRSPSMHSGDPRRLQNAERTRRATWSSVRRNWSPPPSSCPSLGSAVMDLRGLCCPRRFPGRLLKRWASTNGPWGRGEHQGPLGRVSWTQACAHTSRQNHHPLQVEETWKPAGISQKRSRRGLIQPSKPLVTGNTISRGGPRNVSCY